MSQSCIVNDCHMIFMLSFTPSPSPSPPFPPPPPSPSSGGGISSYTDPAEAAESLRNCLSGLLKEVPKKYYAHSYKVKTWLGATAGMRLLK